jgi:hypothetical protein
MAETLTADSLKEIFRFPFRVAPLCLYATLVGAVLFGQMYGRMRDTGPPAPPQR